MTVGKLSFKMQIFHPATPKTPVRISLICRGLVTTLLISALADGASVAAILDIPFDFSRRAIGIDVTVHGVPLYVMLDTGVDPSVISNARAKLLGLKVDHASGGEASGYGDSKSAEVFPTTIDGLAIRGRSFPPIDALAVDVTAISRKYGRDIDGVLGYSFLKDKIVLIDYAAQTVTFLDRAVHSDHKMRRCSIRWSTRLQFWAGDNTPVIPKFRFGNASGPITLDTGSNHGISLFDRAFDSPAVIAAVVEKGETEHTGALGNAKSKTYSFEAPVGFGPFSLPAGQLVNRIRAESKDDKRFANVGNQLFAEMGLKILLSYRDKRLTFYGSCPAL
jgi:Aspartyl protease